MKLLESLRALLIQIGIKLGGSSGLLGIQFESFVNSDRYKANGFDCYNYGSFESFVNSDRYKAGDFLTAEVT